MLAKRMRRRFVPVVFVILSAGAPATAGLLGGFAHSLGIGGSIGGALGGLDGFLPGGGGGADKILGGPGAAAFGGAIDKWREANNDSIAKLGQTNNQTVDRLVQGLGAVEKQLTTDIDQNILTLSDALDSAVSGLDNALQAAVQSLNNSLSTQTGRLDTVFQKQTSTMFDIGRIFVFVFVLGGCFFSISRVLSEEPQTKSIVDVWNHAKFRIVSILVLTLFFVLAACFWPDPLGIDKVSKQYDIAMSRAMLNQDYVQANYNASQLAVLKPSDELVLANYTKTMALISVFYRPTALLDRDKAQSIFSQLNQANAYYNNAKGMDDPDVETVYAIISMQSANTRKELLQASVFSVSAGNDYGLASSENKTAIDNPLIRANVELRKTLAAIGPDPDLIKAAVSMSVGGGIADFEKKYVPTRANPDWLLQAQGDGDDAFTPIDQALSSIRQRAAAQVFYQHIGALFAAIELARFQPGSSPPDVRDRVCDFYRFVQSWEQTNFVDATPGKSFVMALLSGPYRLIARARTYNSDACGGGTSDADISALRDPAANWVDRLSQVSSSGLEKKGLGSLKILAKSLDLKQDAVLDQLENAEKAMFTFDTRLAGGGDVAAQAKSDRLIWIREAQALGLGINLNGAIKPIASWSFDRWPDLAPAEKSALAAEYVYGPI